MKNNRNNFIRVLFCYTCFYVQLEESVERHYQESDISRYIKFSRYDTGFYCVYPPSYFWASLDSSFSHSCYLLFGAKPFLSASPLGFSNPGAKLGSALKIPVTIYTYFSSRLIFISLCAGCSSQRSAWSRRSCWSSSTGTSGTGTPAVPGRPP